MSWIEKNALNRIFNVYKRFKEQKGKLWDNDITALETLSTAIENHSEAYVNDNILFAKLLAVQLRQETEHFGDVKQAIRNIGISLSQPLDYHLEALRLQINDSEDIKYFNELGLHFKEDTKDNRLAKEKILKDSQKEIFKKITAFWTIDKVKKAFYSTGNDFLKDLDNYK